MLIRIEVEKLFKHFFVFNVLVLKLIESAALPNRTGPCEPAKLVSSYDEYTLEHEVTRPQAIEALKRINESFFHVRTPGCKVIKCTSTVMKYCLSSHFLNDHCWCEQGHSQEGLPWVPHSCYVGDNKHEPSVGTCFFYADVKECCCDQALAKRWKFLSGSSQLQVTTVHVWLPFLMPFIQRIFLNRFAIS